MTQPTSDQGRSGARNMPVVVKWILAAVLTVICTAGGVYIGFTAGLSGVAGSDIPRFENRTILAEGTKFPNYEIWDTERAEKTTVADVAASGPMLLIFMSRECSACMSMVHYWNDRVVPELDGRVKIVCLFDDDDWYGGTNPDSLVRPRGSYVYTADRGEQVDEDGMTGTPAFVAIDSDRTIKLVVSGFDRRLRADVISKLF